MKIEAVTVCVGYADFLAQTVPHNLPLFDRWVVVTVPGDIETRDICRRHNLYTLTTEEDTRDGPFSKGRMVRKGLEQLHSDDWLVHLDADLALPYDLRHSLEQAHLDPDTIYGIDRVMVTGWDDWQRVRLGGYLQGGQRDFHSRVNFLAGLPVGARWASPSHGFVPIGFFQLWHSSAAYRLNVHQRPYPMGHGTAARSDVQHGLQWDRRKRALLPEVIGVHLESGPSSLGANWAGRTTKRFGPVPRIKKELGGPS
jgi:hypothetical protein